MMPEKLLEILKYEGVVAIVTQGEQEPHVVNTWNSYIRVTGEDSFLIPAGYMKETEANIEKNNAVQLTIGSREVQGFNGPGTGFLIRGTAEFLKEGAKYDLIKVSFPWARAALEVKITSAVQTL
ncbi:pyridoxamine 5'-phosphate oxidase family protein [Clostridium sp. CX1]|uniref:Pyridoxamine 5'-phosphate oxidase family protein n=1 Tax=Clostridium tanneri TaxID=3037988 RepID=A0ABU4JR67_9CLOT|nr:MULTISPECIES: pyridoxamine 5'-phosphate oxidase family protein [unclassified Clostridium]MCT8978420.1 pyridoxamine 5'-phosphate oxidase family protein [Clostridium sp. CX1]MDW8800451.1 pyridoxamine 5'-phosphate oxidase family protein [Clostridium sp. A1-XYC3]